jgi:dihydrofolate reductase
MSMSLDGFIAGPDDGPGNGLGNGGLRLHEWLGEPVSEYPHFDPSGLSGQVLAELMATGAVVVGRKTFDYARRWGGDHHGVPIFVPTRGTPPEPQSGWVHYVPDAATAMREAKAAGGKDVMVHGANLAQSLLREGLLDELEIHPGRARRRAAAVRRRPHRGRADAGARCARRHAPALQSGVGNGRSLMSVSMTSRRTPSSWSAQSIRLSSTMLAYPPLTLIAHEGAATITGDADR